MINYQSSGLRGCVIIVESLPYLCRSWCYNLLVLRYGGCRHVCGCGMVMADGEVAVNPRWLLSGDSIPQSKLASPRFQISPFSVDIVAENVRNSSSPHCAQGMSDRFFFTNGLLNWVSSCFGRLERHFGVCVVINVTGSSPILPGTFYQYRLPCVLYVICRIRSSICPHRPLAHRGGKSTNINLYLK